MKRFMIGTAIALTTLSALTTACGGDKGVGPIDTLPDDTTDTIIPPPPARVATVALAGNIVVATQSRLIPGQAGLTAGLIASLPDTTIVMPIGDLTGDGSEAAFSIYQNSWGQFKERSRPALGNHEYDVFTDANFYFQYFGAGRAGEAGKGWYSFEAGAWHVVVLTVNERARAGTPMSYASGEEQMAWLQADLMANRSKRCTMVITHDGRFLSSDTTTSAGNPWNVRTNQAHVWNMLYAENVDVVVSANEHWYERFAPMDAMGTRDDAKGIVQFNVGTGGNGIEAVEGRYPHPNRATVIRNYGVLRMDLKETSADFSFLNATAPSVTDAGTVTCH